jgi:thiol-disulfide isomerase/thioredoxin
MNKQLLKESINRKEKSILFFNATWCGACRDSYKTVDQIKESKPDYKFYDIDVDDKDSNEIGELFEVDFLPTIVIISETGYKTYSGKSQIKKLLK